jgi:hypothetical protein
VSIGDAVQPLPPDDEELPVVGGAGNGRDDGPVMHDLLPGAWTSTAGRVTLVRGPGDRPMRGLLGRKGMSPQQRALEAYERGELVLVDLLVRLGGWLAVEEAGPFVASLPGDLCGELRRYISGCPGTEDGWSRMRFLAVATWARGVTREQAEAGQREDARLLRRAVELLRPHLAVPHDEVTP